MSNSNLPALIVTMSICESMHERLEQMGNDFQDTLIDVLGLVNGMLTQPVTPEVAAAFEKISGTD